MDLVTLICTFVLYLIGLPLTVITIGILFNQPMIYLICLIPSLISIVGHTLIGNIIFTRNEDEDNLIIIIASFVAAISYSSICCTILWNELPKMGITDYSISNLNSFLGYGITIYLIGSLLQIVFCASSLGDIFITVGSINRIYITTDWRRSVPSIVVLGIVLIVGLVGAGFKESVENPEQRIKNHRIIEENNDARMRELLKPSNPDD